MRILGTDEWSPAVLFSGGTFVPAYMTNMEETLMKIWNAPALQELDVKLTAKDYEWEQERDTNWTNDCGWVYTTYTATTAS